jgi:hypothetical protein|tara:strand:- start:2533 stop:3087 length:555 start_codon:yes stop_codon:yes gene_type:complete
MSNASVISTPTVGKPRELNQGGTGTAALVFSTDGDTTYLLPLPSAGQLASGSGTTGRSSMVTVRAWGRVTGGTTTNYTATLQYGTSTTSTDNTTIEASTARAVNSADHEWLIEATFVIDSVSDKIQGFGRSMVANLLDSEAALDNVPTSVDVTADGTLGFVVAGTFSAGNASNTSHLDGFQIVL